MHAAFLINTRARLPDWTLNLQISQIRLASESTEENLATDLERD
jgi:hypothetical protein